MSEYLILLHIKESPKTYNHLKGPYQIIAKPTEVTYKFTDSTKKEIVQHRNNLLPYYPKENALRELTQIYSFKVMQNNTQIEQETNVHDDIHHKQNQKQNTKTPDTKISQKERKNRKMIEKPYHKNQ